MFIQEKQMESSQNKLDRTRKPRVHIKYEVETEGKTEVKELPLVIGVLGDFSGDSREPLKQLRDRKFVQIDTENFNDVMKRMTPGLNFKVENTLDDDNTELSVHLKFDSIDDFHPENLVKQIPVLQKLLDTRNKLRDLLTKVDRSEDLENLLEQILKNQSKLEALSKELDVHESNNKEI